MNAPRFLVTLTILNLCVLLLSLVQHAAPVLAQVPATVLRAQALEIVDEQGRVRASLSVLPAGTSPAGESYSETVRLRLITEKGRPSIKVGASEQTSGISVAGPTGTKDTYAILEANSTSTPLKLRGENGKEPILRP